LKARWIYTLTTSKRIRADRTTSTNCASPSWRWTRLSTHGLTGKSMKNPKCHNCKHAGPQFKIHKLTHLHCEHPKYEGKDVNPWETLCVFSSTCPDHELKSEKSESPINH